jgi:aminomethyltransferase
MKEQTAGEVIMTPLDDLHARAGARMGVWFGCALPDEFGEWVAEYHAARQSVALIDKNYRAHLSFTGPDRARYLNAILTNNIRDLAAGQGIVSLLLNPQGHILAEMETYSLPETLLCVSHAMIRGTLVATLEKFIIMDDVTLTDDTERYATLALEGPKTTAVVRELAAVDLSGLPDLGFAEATVASIPCRIVRRSAGGVAGAEFVIARERVADLWQLLEEKVRVAGGQPMGYSALSALRLEQGIPWFGYDFDEKQIPHEAGLQDTHISFTKGCYTGQEIVERVRSRGHVNRVRVLLKFSTDEPPDAGASLLAGTTEVGNVTRTAFSPALACAIGMGYVRREHSAAGSPLVCADITAEVILPPRP